MSWFGYVPAEELAKAKEAARAESRRANEEKERAAQEKRDADKAKAEATASSTRAEYAKELAKKEIERTLEALEIAEQQTKRADMASTQAEIAARKSALAEEKLEDMRRRKESAEQEKQRLQVEKDEKQKAEKMSMKFAWGPKKTLTWTPQDVKQLRKKFYAHTKDKEGNRIRGKILIFGPSGAGKSSFCNGLRSALEDSDTPTTYHAVGSREGSLTRRFDALQYGDHWIIDMPGIFESNHFKTENIEAIASGRVRFDAEITETLGVEDDLSLTEARRDVSCVLVLHHGIILGDELKRQIDEIIRLWGGGILSCHLVLTHLDDCDPQFKASDNLPNLYNSPLVQEAVKMMSEQTGIPPYAISYVKNYVTETETDTNTKLLHLRALDRILTSTADQVEKMINNKRLKNMYEDAPETGDWNIRALMSAGVICVCAVVYMFTQ